MSKIAFIYPGQGAQKAGMGADFYEKGGTAKAIFDQAGEILGLDMKALCFEENDKLDLTEYTQAALVTTCLAMTRTAKERYNGGLEPWRILRRRRGGRNGRYGRHPAGSQAGHFDAEYGSGRRRRHVRGDGA